GGQQQRVAIARAVVGRRQLLLADEPTGALDSLNGEAVLQLIRSRCDAGVAGVLVTHEARLAAWADRVVFLRDGRVVDETEPLPPAESLLSSGTAGGAAGGAAR
ncbi:MAG: putative transport system ATP-binding protein, partial [Mycobacteriales bacterium]